jgi:phosphonate transport system substrate-binding protein
MKQKFIFIFIILYLSQFLNNCGQNNSQDSKEPLEIDFSNNKNKSGTDTSSVNNKSLQIAIAAMTSPNESYSHYNELLQFISQKLNRPVHIIQRKTYAEINSLLSQNKIDLAFICSGAYVSALEENLPIQILAIPIIDSKAYYYAYIIVNKDSKISEFSELKDKSFAYTDPLSNTGYLYGLSKIKELKQNPQNFFSKTIFTSGHDYSIQAVQRKIVDGATVNSLIYDYISKKYPERVTNIKIIYKSEPFGIPPIVIRNDLGLGLKRKLSKLFINLHLDPQGKEILKKLMIDRYSVPDSTDYSTIIQNSRNVGK